MDGEGKEKLLHKKVMGRKRGEKKGSKGEECKWEGGKEREHEIRRKRDEGKKKGN